MSTADLARNIGCALSTVDRVLKSLKRAFGIETSRLNQTGGVRTIRLTSQFVEFFNIYSEEKYQEYIEKYSIYGKDEYTCRQAYRYRIWTTTEKYLTREEQEERKEFMNSSSVRNYIHYVATSNRSNLARVQFIEKFYNKLSDIQKEQLKRIKNTLGKLDYYLHRILIKLEQKCSSFSIKKNDEEYQEQQSTSTHEGNQTEGITSEQKSAARVHQKTPEDPSPEQLRFIGQFIQTWNTTSIGESMNRIQRITENKIQSIMGLLEEYSEREIIDAIRTIKAIDYDTKYKYKMSFERFIQSETMLYLLEYNSIDEDKENNNHIDIIAKTLRQNQELNSVPTFSNIHELKTWIKNK